jgi:hypothetical protein
MSNMFKANLNFQIYQTYYRVKSELQKKVPMRYVGHKQNLSRKLQIGITTYIDRYDEFFKQLYGDVRSLFPEVDLRIAVNGFFDEEEQKGYLRRVEGELCSKSSNNVTFILHDHPVGLTKLWNEILFQSDHEHTLILNDDLHIFPWFRKWLERNEWDSEYVTLIEGTWSNFFISKKAIRKVGWFDEGYQGIGFEDMDYTARSKMMGATITNIRCPFLMHRDHKPTRTSFDNNTSTVWGPKYSSINQQYFYSKWKKTSVNSGIYIKQIDSCVEWTGKKEKPTNPRDFSFINGCFYPDRQ